MKAMIFAAGLGTRLKPLTKNKPKALVEINGKTLLERCILNLKKSGVREIIVNIHHFADEMLDFFAKHNFEGVDVYISDERNELLETGGGLIKAKDLLGKDEPVLLINVDVLTNLDFQQLENYHLKNDSLATLVVRKRNTFRYLLINDEKELCGWMNEKTGQKKISKVDHFEKAAKYAFSGIHMVSPKIFELIEETGKFSIIDLYLRLAKSQRIHAFIDDDSIWMDLGKYEQIEEANRLVKKIDQLNK